MSRRTARALLLLSFWPLAAGCHDDGTSSTGAATSSSSAASASAAPTPITSGATASGVTAAPARPALAPRFSQVASYAAVLPGGDAIRVYHPAPPGLGPRAGLAFPGAVLLQGAQVIDLDLDGDGDKDVVVTGYEAHRVLVLSR